MKSVTKTAPKAETFSIRLDAETVNRLRFVAKEDGVSVETFIAQAAITSLVAAIEGLEIRDEEEATLARVAKLNQRRAA